MQAESHPEKLKGFPQQIQNFYAFHGVQLFGSKFPIELLSQLYHKVTNKIYDAGDYFKIFENPDADTFEVHATKDIMKHGGVFLIDHAISFRYPQLRTILSQNPNIVQRLDNMTKYLGNRKSLPSEQTAEPEDVGNVEYDSMGISDLKGLDIPESTVCLSLIQNNLSDSELIIGLLKSLPNLRALWLTDNPVAEDPKVVEFIENHTNIELYNRRFTKRATTWAPKFVTFKKINKCSIADAQVVYLNLQNRSALNIDSNVMRQFTNLRRINIRDTQIESLEHVNRLVEILKLPNLQKIEADFKTEQIIFQLFKNKKIEASDKIMVNNHNVFMPPPTQKDLTIDQIHNRLFKLTGCYRLASTNQLDQTSIWYVNDELGSSLTHSDNPQVVLCPFLYGANNKMDDKIEALTIMWNVADLVEGQIIERDYLNGLSETKQRSSRLAVWYNLPRDVYRQRYDLFQNKMKELSQKSNEMISKMTPAVPMSPPKYKNQPIRVITDSSLIKTHLTNPIFTFTNDLEDADIVWMDTDLGSEYERVKSKGVVFNQFPHEACLVTKNNLARTIQTTLGTTKFLQRTYDLEVDLPAFIGHFYKNQQEEKDNLWISKPPNMARSLDMLVSDNLDVLIRNMETGPKLVQKYITHPVKRLNRKIDLRFIAMLRSIQPLQAYLYKHFWIRTSNNEYNLDCRFREQYETHFTVMNYGKKLTQIMYPDFVQQFNKDYHPMQWSTVHQKIKNLLKLTFFAAQQKHPQMHCQQSRAMYGIDIMVDEDTFEPKLLEFTFTPDCARACKFYPTFYNEVFEALFLDKLSENVECLF